MNNNRPSLTTNLEQKYKTEHVGGSFDAKSITTDGKHSPILGSIQSARYTKAGFKTKMLDGQTELYEAQGTTSKESSIYMKGFSNVRYGDVSSARGG